MSCFSVRRMDLVWDSRVRAVGRLLKLGGLNGGREQPLRGPGACPSGKCLIFNSLKHVFLHLGVRFGIEIGQRKIQSSSAPYISAPCILNVCNCGFTSRFTSEIRIFRGAQHSVSKS
jgi:hypothetical protein